MSIAPSSSTETDCCVVGGGPAGMVLGLLLARAGVRVTLLESHATFERDFRGDTIHPGILEMLDEIGLADGLLQLPHVKMFGSPRPGADAPELLFDFRELITTRFPYIMLMQQQVFLAYLAQRAALLPKFRLLMSASVQDLVMDSDRVRGAIYRSGEDTHEIRAQLVVGADGRFSRVRKLAGITPIPTSSPLELLWFRLPVLANNPMKTGVIAPRFGKRQLLIMIDRDDHWQCGYFFVAGRYQELRAAGVESMRRNVRELGPRFAESVESLTDWQQFTLLSVASSRCKRWYREGLLLIGDAAHTMSPAAGAGIKYAI